MGTDLHTTARRLRELVEPISSGVYFASGAQERYKDLGLNYFEGYFCSRSACLGKAPWRVVSGIFAAFNPAVVEPAVTGGWSKTEPEPLLRARLDGARDQLEQLVAAPTDDALRAAEILLDISDDLDTAGRPLYAGLRSLDVPGEDDPWGRLWRAGDRVREYRGDGHVAAWISEVDSTEISVLTEHWWGIEPGSYVWTRGWSDGDADAARARLTDRGLLDGSGLTADGHELREQIERRTDRSARALVANLGDRADELLGLLEPMAAAIVAGGGYPSSPGGLADSLKG